MNIKPLSDRVVIKPIEQDDITPGGVYVPEMAKEKPVQGKVLAIGAGRVENGVRIEMTVQVGDVVLYTKYTGTEIKVEGEKVLILREADILAIKG